MRLIQEEPVNDSKLYLLYDCNPEFKQIIVFKPGDNVNVTIVALTRVSLDLHNNLAVYEYHNHSKRETVEENFTFFKSLNLSNIAIYELTDDEANLILAQLI